MNHEYTGEACRDHPATPSGYHRKRLSGARKRDSLAGLSPAEQTSPHPLRSLWVHPHARGPQCDRGSRFPIAIQELVTFRTSCDMVPNDFPLAFMQNLECSSRKQLLQFRMNSCLAHDPSSTWPKACLSFCIARRMRVFTVPSGWEVR